jgi:hypothetical protein
VADISITFEVDDFKRIMEFCSLYLDEKSWHAMSIACGTMREMVTIYLRSQ